MTPIHGNDSERSSYLRIDRATIIGNAIITDYGIDYNVVYDSLEPSRPMLPIRAFIPNMMMGMNRSVVDRMKKLQDDVDAYEYKIRQNIGKDLGKVYLINGHKLGDGDTVRELVTNLKKYGMHVTDGSDGEDPNVLDGQRMVETVDMTLDQNVIRYTQLIQEKGEDDERNHQCIQSIYGSIDKLCGLRIAAAVYQSESIRYGNVL